MLFRKIVGYLDITKLFKRDEKVDFNLRMMHGINRISIFMFIICLIVLIIRFFTR